MLAAAVFACRRYVPVGGPICPSVRRSDRAAVSHSGLTGRHGKKPTAPRSPDWGPGRRRPDFYLLRPGALAEGLPVVSRQLEAPEVPAWGPGFPPSAWLDSFTWSVPKYENPGEDGSPAGATQCAAEALDGTTANAATAATAAAVPSFLRMYNLRLPAIQPQLGGPCAGVFARADVLVQPSLRQTCGRLFRRALGQRLRWTG